MLAGPQIRSNSGANKAMCRVRRGGGDIAGDGEGVSRTRASASKVFIRCSSTKEAGVDSAAKGNRTQVFGQGTERRHRQE